MRGESLPFGFYVFNSRVAWQVRSDIGVRFQDGVYLPIDGWKIISKELIKGKWYQGELGEWRRVEKKKSRGGSRVNTL